MCTLNLLRPSTPSSPSPLSMTFPPQDVHSPTTNSELLTVSSPFGFPQGSHIHTNTHANSHSQLSLNGLEPSPCPSASTHSNQHSHLHSQNLSVFSPLLGLLPIEEVQAKGNVQPIIDFRDRYYPFTWIRVECCSHTCPPVSAETKHVPCFWPWLVEICSLSLATSQSADRSQIWHRSSLM
jgi:hypothetical protein